MTEQPVEPWEHGVPRCPICHRRHWLRDGCAGDMQQRMRTKGSQSPAPAASAAEPGRRPPAPIPEGGNHGVLKAEAARPDATPSRATASVPRTPGDEGAKGRARRAGASRPEPGAAARPASITTANKGQAPKGGSRTRGRSRDCSSDRFTAQAGETPATNPPTRLGILDTESKAKKPAAVAKKEGQAKCVPDGTERDGIAKAAQRKIIKTIKGGRK